MNKFLLAAIGLLWGHPEAIVIVIVIVVVINTVLEKTDVNFALFLGFHNRN